MDQGLFSRHIRNIQERDLKKKQLLESILEETGVLLEESEVTISKTHVSIATSSVKKTTLLKKGLQHVLEGKGMQLTL